MMQQLNLLYDVAQEYHIPRGNNETELNWKCRVAYSLLGQAGYASLWDTLDEMDLDGQILSSIVHFRRRIEKTLLGLLTIYPDLSGIYTSEFDKVSKELYYIMTSSGYVLVPQRCLHVRCNTKAPFYAKLSNQLVKSAVTSVILMIYLPNFLET